MLLRRMLVAVALFGLFLGLYAWRMGGALHNGDEAIYAEMAREGGGVLHWQGQPVLNRPPAAVWVLAAAVRVLGDGDRVVRGVIAVEAALAVALLFGFAAIRYGEWVGVVAALVLGASDLYFRYARYIESEPLLLVFTLAAFLCWQKRWVIGFGVCLAGALMTKQLVGALPLLAPILDRDRRIWRALAVAAVLALPWHIYAWARFGSAFPQAFLWQNVVLRGSVAMHDQTGPGFYLEMLWQRERPLILVALVGMIFTLAKRDWLPAIWTLAVLAPFSLAASRYDYYALLAYPALAIATARVCVDAVPRLRGPLSAAVVIATFALHGIPRTRLLDVGPREMRFLSALVEKNSLPTDVLLIVDDLPYTARYYANRYTVELEMDRVEEPSILPAVPIRAPDLGVATQLLPRWFAIAPSATMQRVQQKFGARAKLVARTPNYFLFTNLEGPG
jgi:4-amino-4-deoxy-L-arabinose transferase-like glycosyltransferase